MQGKWPAISLFEWVCHTTYFVHEPAPLGLVIHDILHLVLLTTTHVNTRSRTSTSTRAYGIVGAGTSDGGIACSTPTTPTTPTSVGAWRQVPRQHRVSGHA